MAEQSNALPMTNSSLPQHQSSMTSGMERQSQLTVAMLLSRLAIHYYRPDFTEGQAKLLIQDMIEDLAQFSIRDIELAIKIYRQNAENKYFPRGADLRKIILDGRPPIPRHQEPPFRGYPKPERPATKSVGDVLRGAGFPTAATSYENWKAERDGKATA